jgi:hypothetical protein
MTEAGGATLTDNQGEPTTLEESLRVLSGIAQRTRAKKLLISGAAITGAALVASDGALHRVPAASISGGCSTGCRTTLRLS